MAEAFGHNDFEDHRSRQIAREFEERMNNNEVFFMDLARVSQIYDFYVEGQEWKRALALVSFALDTFPTNSQLHYQKSYLLFELGNHKRAEESIEQALILSPLSQDYLGLKADIYGKMGRYEDAIEILNSCLAFTDDLSKLLLHMGNIAQICQRPKESETYYLEAIAEKPGFDEALIELTYLYESEDKITEAIATCEKYLDNNPYSHTVWYRLGCLNQKVSLFDQALDAYEYALVIKDDYEDALLKKGEILFCKDKYQEALQSYLSALYFSPENVHTLYQIGDCYENLEFFHDAIKYYGRVTKHDPYHIDAWIGLGFCLERREKYLEAIHYYQKAYKLDSENADLCLAMAICEYKLGQRYNAYLYLEQAISLSPSDISIWQDWARVLYDHKNPIGAVTYLEEGIKINPNEALLYFYCAAYCFDIGMMDKAFTYLENGLILDPAQHTILFELLPVLKKEREILELIEQYQ
ncbi:MAG: tetratricopeptide repeat protein [Bacteroidia bacterium]|nr:tetratricopeptide repeat protein [Bacteroidia bacterium]